MNKTGGIPSRQVAQPRANQAGNTSNIHARNRGEAAWRGDVFYYGLWNITGWAHPYKRFVGAQGSTRWGHFSIVLIQMVDCPIPLLDMGRDCVYGSPLSGVGFKRLVLDLALGQVADFELSLFGLAVLFSGFEGQ